MGFIRGFFLFIVGILLIISLLAGNVFMTITLSLDYENVQPQLVSAANDLITGKINAGLEEVNLTEQFDEEFQVMIDYCEDNTENSTEYVFNEGGYTFVLSCDTISQGTGAIIEDSVGKIVDDLYYKEYDCGFFDCLEETGSPMFLISEKAHDYWKSKFYIALIVSIVLVVLTFFLVKKKANFPVLVGILLILTSLPFMKLAPFFSFLDDTILSLATIFISKSSTVFWWAFIIGLVILAVGILMHFVKFGIVIAEKLDKLGKKKSSSKENSKNKKDGEKD